MSTGSGMNIAAGSALVVVMMVNGSGDDGSAGAAIHLARCNSIEGGDNEMIGDGGGGKAKKSLNLLSLMEKGLGDSGRFRYPTSV
ncbi:hypothetical protein Tco_1484469 [Tanacetum coccineum]